MAFTSTGPTTKDTAALALGLMDIRVGNSAANITQTNAVLTSDDSIGALASVTLRMETELFEHRAGFPARKDFILPISETATLECAFEEITPKNLAISRGIDPTSAGTTWLAYGYKVVDSSAGTYNTADTIDGDADAENDTYRVIFTGATTYDVWSDTRGKLTGTGDTTASSAFTDGALALLTIPANFFTGTWAANEVFSFSMGKQGYDSNTSGEIKLGALAAPEYIRVEGIYVYPDKVRQKIVVLPRAQAVSNPELAFANDTNASMTITFEGTPADSKVVGGNAAWDDAPTGRIYWTV